MAARADTPCPCEKTRPQNGQPGAPADGKVDHQHLCPASTNDLLKKGVPQGPYPLSHAGPGGVGIERPELEIPWGMHRTHMIAAISEGGGRGMRLRGECVGVGSVRVSLSP